MRRTFALAGLVLAVLIASRAARAQTAGESSLARGRELYEKKEYAAALAQFRDVRALDPTNAEAALLAGLAALRLDRPADAARDWADFVKHAQDRALAVDVSKYTTILLAEAYERAAKQALAEEKRLASTRTDARTVAVGAFRNLGTPEYAPLGKAISAMLIDNLSAVPSVTVLEREQVQALMDEAKLAESGLVAPATAVRAGKLLRAGRVTAGTHLDWRGSPVHLKIVAILVDVNGGKQLATADAEGLVEKFHELVPRLSTSLVPALTGASAAALPSAAQKRVRNAHTRSLPAALAFGRVLEAKDDQDPARAEQECENVRREDPDFELAKRTCGLLPPVWLSQQAVASAIESSLAIGTASTLSTAAPWLLGGAVAAGAGIGAAVAVGGGGGGGGGADGNRPNLQGGGERAVPALESTGFDLTCADPQGSVTRIEAQNLPPGATFEATPGNPAIGRFRWRPGTGDVGRHSVTFVCVDGQNESSTVRGEVSVGPPLPTPVPGGGGGGGGAGPSGPAGPTPAVPTPTPAICLPVGTGCSDASQCCTQLCEPIQDLFRCCLPTGGSCGTNAECCGTNCTNGSCCSALFAACGTTADCCTGLACGPQSACCVPAGAPCTTAGDCCLPGSECASPGPASGVNVCIGGFAP